MRNISLSFLLAAACICCIQSCKNGISTGTLSTSATYPLSDSTDAELELKIDVEYIISGPGAAVRNINSAIILGLFGEKYGEMDIQEAVSAYSAAVSAEYREANRPLLEDSLFSSPAAMLNWSDWTQGAVSGTHGNILSYTVTKYTYTGGAHGMTSETTLNFDTDNGSLIGETGTALLPAQPASARGPAGTRRHSDAVYQGHPSQRQFQGLRSRHHLHLQPV